MEVVCRHKLMKHVSAAVWFSVTRGTDICLSLLGHHRRGWECIAVAKKMILNTYDTEDFVSLVSKLEATILTPNKGVNVNNHHCSEMHL